MQMGTEELRAAVLNARAAALNAAIAGMVAANQERESAGYALAYDEGAFTRAIDEYRLGTNDVINVVLHGNL